MKTLTGGLLFIAILSFSLIGCYQEEAKIVDDYWFGDYNKYNGWALAIDGNFTAIGNPQGYNVYDFKTGSVYIAERKNGNWLANPTKIAPTDLNANDFFGFSVGMDSDRLIIGANHRQEARIYVRTTGAGNDNIWSEQTRLQASDGASGDSFGVSVDISGNWAIVGAPYDDNGKGTDAGAVYMYQWTAVGCDYAWVQQGKCLASDGASGDIYGWSVAIDGDYAVVGAPYDDNQKGTNAGSIYILRRNGIQWVQDAKLIASDGAANDELGDSVAMWGNYFLAGAQYDDNAKGSNAGAAYLFMRNGSTYAQRMKLVAEDGAPNDRFGASVAMTEFFAVIGAPYEDDAGTDAGAAYFYLRETNDLLFMEKHVASDGAAGDHFGYRSAIDGYYAAISAPYDDNTVGADAGSVYMFED